MPFDSHFFLYTLININYLSLREGNINDSSLSFYESSSKELELPFVTLDISFIIINIIFFSTIVEMILSSKFSRRFMFAVDSSRSRVLLVVAISWSVSIHSPLLLWRAIFAVDSLRFRVLSAIAMGWSILTYSPLLRCVGIYKNFESVIVIFRKRID